MSKLIDINEYMKLSTYAEKYGVCKRKLYRHRNNDDINYISIDGIFFIKDEPSILLNSNNSSKVFVKSVKFLTSEGESVKNLTLKTNNHEKELVIGVKNLTLNENSNVKNLTLVDRLNELEAIPENDRKISDYKEISEIRKKL